MSPKLLLHIAPLTVPFCVALICALVLFRHYQKERSLEMNQPLRMMVISYFTAVFAWFSIITYIAVPSFFAIINPLLLFAFIACHIFLYHFMFLMTKAHGQERFSKGHYVFPVLAFLTITVWSFFVPLEVQIKINESGGGWVQEYKLYSIFYTSKLLFYFIFNCIYAILGLRRTMRYRKLLVNYSADEQRISLKWLYQIYFVLIGALPMSIITLFMTRNYSNWPLFTLLPISIIIFRDVIIAHNLLTDNYVMITPDSPERELQAQQTEQHPEPILREDIKRLETYMRKQKPYLNPKLKITDLTEELNTNRTSLSRLINRTYGMNFSRYINRFRLDELEKIKSNPKNANLNELEMVANAGFSDYRGYQRTQGRELNS